MRSMPLVQQKQAQPHQHTSSTHDDATGSAETPDDKATRDSAKENAAAADESKAHKATEDMIATSEKR